MKICEHVPCKKERLDLYGSGRFCSAICARAYSTTSKRIEINKKVSLKLQGKWNGYGFKKGYDSNRKVFTDEERKKAIEKVKLNRRKAYKIMDWLDLPHTERRKRILEEQEGVCLKCKYSRWMGSPLTLELDHKNGNHSDNKRENLRILCPNCHSQTPTYRNKKRDKTCN